VSEVTFASRVDAPSIEAPSEAGSDGVLPRLFEFGARAQARMEREFDDHIRKLTMDGAVVTCKATESLPRWTHVRQR